MKRCATTFLPQALWIPPLVKLALAERNRAPDVSAMLARRRRRPREALVDFAGGRSQGARIVACAGDLGIARRGEGVGLPPAVQVDFA